MGKSLVLKDLDKQNNLNKISLLASRFSLLAFCFFVFLLSSNVFPQVIIKEKVEINPQNNILPEYPQSNLDPCLSIHRPPYYQSVYSCSSYPVEPYQQNYPWQAYYNYGMQLDSATIYNLEIISGSEYAYFYKVGHWDTTTHAPVDEEYIGSTLNGLTGVELAGWGRYEAFHWSGTFEREHWSYYHIRYQNFSENEVDVIYRITNTSTNENTEWHTTIVNPQYTMQNLGIDGDTVLHNRALIVTPNIHNSLVLTCLQFGYGSCPPTNVTFSIEMLEGMEYGNIGRYNDFLEEFEYAPSFTGLSFDEFAFGFYNFNANGLQPDSTAVVRIRQSSSDADIGSFEYTLYIKRNFLPPVSENGSIVIETNKNTAMPGDTIDILLKWEDGANGIVDFSDWQEFSVWLADGFSYGTLLNTATGDTSDAFDVIGKELKLVVHQNVTDVNKKIVIAAETVVAVLGGNRMMQNNLQPKNETKSTVKKNLNNYRTLEQGGFVKAKDKNKNDKEDKVDDGEINIDFVISEVYLSGVKEIIVNPFIVEVDPPTVSAGDTARIIPKYRDESGNYVEFPTNQTFELGILDGCPLGYLSAEADSNKYFYEVKQPFYFIADSSADSGIVSLRVGVINMNQQNRSLTNNNNNTPESDNPVSCANVSFVENLYVNANVVVGNECDEEIVVCDSYQPPKFEDVGTVTVLPEDTSWQWLDSQGNPMTTNTGDACNFDIRPNRIDFGKTYIMPSIGNFSSANPPDPIYNLLDDIAILVCLDSNDPENPVWQYSVDNLRVPIFSDVCHNLATQASYIDLGDCTDENILSTNIKDCIDFDKVNQTLDYWWKGSYHSYKKPPPYKFYFSAGVKKHEEIHQKQLITGGTSEYPIGAITQEMDGKYGLPYLGLLKQAYASGECPTDALIKKILFQSNQEIIKDFIKEKVMISAIVRANLLLSNSQFHATWLEPKCEVEADELARGKYDEIKQNLENWAKQQSWWCIESIGGSFNCSGNKCN